MIASLAGFGAVQVALSALTSNVIVNEAIAVNIMAGITGSAAGGLGLALGMLGKTYLAAATAAFVAHGMQASIEAIAQVAGVSKPTLYARYPDRLALFEAVLGQLHRNRGV